VLRRSACREIAAPVVMQLQSAPAGCRSGSGAVQNINGGVTGKSGKAPPKVAGTRWPTVEGDAPRVVCGVHLHAGCARQAAKYPTPERARQRRRQRQRQRDRAVHRPQRHHVPQVLVPARIYQMKIQGLTHDRAVHRPQQHDVPQVLVPVRIQGLGYFRVPSDSTSSRCWYLCTSVF
jgi:hypothetical protein